MAEIMKRSSSPAHTYERLSDPFMKVHEWVCDLCQKRQPGGTPSYTLCNEARWLKLYCCADCMSQATDKGERHYVMDWQA